MSIDTLGRQASEALFAATADLDAQTSLRRNLESSRGRRRLSPALVVVAAVVILVVGWAFSGDLQRSAVPAPPLDTPLPVLVGKKLGGPITAVAPTGWEVINDRAYVEMRPADGSPGMQVFMVVPRRVYDPPSDELVPLKDDPVVWITTHPEVKTLDKFGVDGPGSAWTATAVDLSLSPKAKNDWVHLLPLSMAPGSPPLAITANNGMDRWIIIDFEKSRPLIIAATSPTRDDPDLATAINQLLASIQIQQN